MRAGLYTMTGILSAGEAPASATSRGFLLRRARAFFSSGKTSARCRWKRLLLSLIHIYFGYTIDGGPLGEFCYETFNAAEVNVRSR